MLVVQKFLKENCRALSTLDALLRLQEVTGIKHTIWEDTLVVLNYCQIESKKTCAMARECRSLVLELGTWEVVSRSFDRFFNYGEEPCPAINPAFMTAFEKVDGSLIGLFNYRGEWLYRTRSVIMPVSSINGWETTWKEHIEEALGTNYMTRLTGMEHLTYIMELTSRENRVVTKYDHQGPMMTLLAIRDNESGLYEVRADMVDYVLNGIPEWRTPRQYKFETMTDCLEAAKELRNLEEGFVMYTKYGEPICKVKNPAYVAAHHLRGEGLNPKRVKDLILMNEVDEYLSIFPEDKEVFTPYTDAYRLLMHQIELWIPVVHNQELTQKEFALKILDLPFKSILFNMRKGMTLLEAWDLATTNSKYQMIDAMMGEVNGG